MDNQTTNQAEKQHSSTPTHKLRHTLGEKRQAVFTRFPLLFTLLTTFGLVATLYGFERVIDRIDVLAENPFILLRTGIITLGLTGSLYKKLAG